MSDRLDQLPVLGVGASLSLAARPDPVALVAAPGGPAFVEYAGLADVAAVVDEVARVRAAGAPVLFHPSYINFCGSHANDAHWLAATAEHLDAVGSPWFAQDCAYCFWDGGPGYSSQFGYFIPPILNRASLDRAVARVREVRERVPVPVAIEPPPVSFVVGAMPVLAFFGELAERADCALLLDMGHLVSYEMATGRPVTEALAALPAERVIEVHVAGGTIEACERGDSYIDAHEQPVQAATWAMLARMLPELPALKAVCFECEGVEESEVLATLARIRGEVRTHSACAALVAQLDGQAAS
ncbi:MAG TPA: DUF692 family protein [Pseudomonadales bacterium]|nr:DUF692 family protein [Pseudomonadales bacterium]